jgi:hypothetical protein
MAAVPDSGAVSCRSDAFSLRGVTVALRPSGGWPNPAFQRMPGRAEAQSEGPAQPGTAER